MNQPFYSYNSNNEHLYFEFLSISQNKTVKKMVIFTPFYDNPDIYNLTLADAFDDGTFSDKTITNNEDMEKVMATVIQTILCFFENYPDKFVYFEGSTPERTRLYRIIISRELTEIDKTFNTYGIIDEEFEPFQKNRPYNSFLIALQNKKNLLKLLYEND